MIPDLEKHPFPNSVTDDGIVMDINELHPKNVHLSIFDTEVGIMIDVNELHSEKALSPITETDDGMKIDFNE